jgi:hypothetical protein
MDVRYNNLITQHVYFQPCPPFRTWQCDNLKQEILKHAATFQFPFLFPFPFILFDLITTTSYVFPICFCYNK